MRSKSTTRSWLSPYIWFTAFMTLCLICLGGVVTSKGAGLAVPDWPNTYGYNMFLFPVSKWIGGVFYEHTHRLLASFVGLLTIVLLVWTCLRETRKWMKTLAAIALAAVILQGVLGGLRVTLLKDQLGVAHAALAQLFFSLICFMGLARSSWWRNASDLECDAKSGRVVRICFLALTVLIGVQLLLGAGMRHAHAGLAVPDFPTAYGKIWPDTDPESIARYNQNRMEVRAVNDITPAQILLHMSHRATALALLLGMIGAFVFVRSRLGRGHRLAKLTLFWLSILFCQAGLGAFTVWSNKAADVATVHVAVGAVVLALGIQLCALAFRGRVRETADKDVRDGLSSERTQPGLLAAG